MVADRYSVDEELEESSDQDHGNWMNTVNIKLHPGMISILGWETSMQVETHSDDCWPFPSKVFALLYFLLQSPHSWYVQYDWCLNYCDHCSNGFSLNMQGQSNLRFIWYIRRH